MRGPGYKISGDVRRTWRCPYCGGQRKLSGDVTTLKCGCRDDAWMQIVTERTSAPRPIQRPSDVERHPIDFGIEPTPPAPPKPEATIVKPAISPEPEPETDVPQSQPTMEATDVGESAEEQPKDDDWGEGIF